MKGARWLFPNAFHREFRSVFLECGGGGGGAELRAQDEFCRARESCAFSRINRDKASCSCAFPAISVGAPPPRQ